MKLNEKMGKILNQGERQFSGLKTVIGFSNAMQNQLCWEKHILDRPGGLLSIRSSGEILYRGNSLMIAPGDLILYRGLPLHTFKGYSDWSYYWFHVPENFFRDISKIPCNTKVPGVWKTHFVKSVLGRIRLEFQETYSLQLLRPTGWEKLMDQLLRVILIRAENALYSAQLSAGDSMQSIIRMIGERGFDRKVGDIARICGMSRASLFQKFREELGCSPTEYRDNCIIAAAKQLLSSSSMQIQEVAWHLHFHDSFYFSKFFRMKTGLTPTEFRKRSQE